MVLEPLEDPYTSWTIFWGDDSQPTKLTGSSVTAEHIYAENNEGDGKFTVFLTANTASGMSYFAGKLEVRVNNVAPVINTIEGPSSIYRWQNYPLELATTDPGLVDVITYTINWGDGTDPQIVDGDVSLVTHRFESPNSYTITVTAS